MGNSHVGTIAISIDCHYDSYYSYCSRSLYNVYSHLRTIPPMAADPKRSWKPHFGGVMGFGTGRSSPLGWRSGDVPGPPEEPKTMDPRLAYHLFWDSGPVFWALWRSRQGLKNLRKLVASKHAPLI